MFEEVGISFSAQSFWIWTVGVAPILAYSFFLFEGEVFDGVVVFIYARSNFVASQIRMVAGRGNSA